MTEPQIPVEAPDLSEHPYRLMTPGPVPVHPQVLEALALPPLHHRTPEFAKVFSRIRSQLQKVFQTEQPVFTLTSSGSGAMEASIVNTLSPGDRVLVLESGKFGERWSKICDAYQIQADATAFSWGEPYEAERLRKELQLNDYKAVLCQACETSTGVLHPVEDLAKVVREFSNTLLIVDGITAVGATKLPMDEWGIDVLVAGSQKAFMLPTGLSFIAFSEKAWKAQAESTLPKFYWDLKAEKEANENNQTNFSSAVNLLRGLEVALNLMLSEGLSKHLSRIQNLALATRAGGEELGLSIFPDPPSPSLTVFQLPTDVDGQKVRLHMEEKYNLTIMGGQERLKGKILRIGHMGYISDEDAIITLRFLGQSLNELYPMMFSNAMTDKAVAAMEKCLNS